MIVDNQSCNKGSVHINYDYPLQAGTPQAMLISSLLRIVRDVISNYAIDKKTRRFRVLDVCCGRGELLERLSHFDIDLKGLDIDPNCVSMSKKYCECIVHDIYDIDSLFEENSFDLIICSHGLEHLENPKDVIIKLTKISSKFILLAVPNLISFHLIFYSLFRREYNVKEGHVCGWDRPHFHNLLINHCSIYNIKWMVDMVQIFPSKLSKFRIVRYVQSFLPSVFPYFSRSLIMLGEKVKI